MDTKVMNSINKKFGKNAIRRASELMESLGEMKRVSTDNIALDIAIGGGIPIGRFIELSGAFSSTKTTQSLHIIKMFQEAGYKCAYFDIEGTTEVSYMQSIGIDIDELYLSYPDGLEECAQMIVDLQRKEAINLAVIDSIESMTPTKETEKDMDDTMRVGLRATKLGEFLRKYTSANNRLTREDKTPLTLIGVNQLREAPMSFGDPEYTPGGKCFAS